MSKLQFVYTTYFETTAGKLWHALTDGDFNERYSAISSVGLESWLVLSLRQPGKLSVEGKVLRASDPARRLAYTWTTARNRPSAKALRV